MRKKRSAKIGATAKIEAVAKASYARKKTTTEIIPPDVTRAKTSAWLDLISPLTEWAGLKGDRLRFQRTQLRLQREDVLAEIARRATEKLGQGDTVSGPIPNKFVVPFLEQASLESPNSPLIDMWASLLASAAKDFSSYHIHFVSIISRLSPKQGQLFETLLGTRSARELDLSRDIIQGRYESHKIRAEVERLAAKLPARTSEYFFKSIEALFAQVGVEPVYAGAEELKTKKYYDILDRDLAYRNSNEVDYSILEAVGLIRWVDTDFFDVGDWAIVLKYYHLTQLGYHFAVACGLVDLDAPMDEVE